MKRDPHDHERALPLLREEPSGDPVLDELGRWFGALPPAPSLEQAGLARVARRLEAGNVGRRKTWRSAAVGLAFVAFAGASTAMWARHRASAPQVTSTPRSTATASRQPRSPVESRATRPVPTSAALPAAPSASLSASPPETARLGVRTTSPSTPSVAPGVASAPESSLAFESAALERALTALRRDHDAERALELLERYSADFPAGVLRTEADVARVDANLALGRHNAALALLERLPLERVGRGPELTLVRGELLATRDCRRANLDFDRVLAAHPSPSLDERALFGRASCRLGTGDFAGGQTDLRSYLARYPRGRFAEAARQRLR